MSRLNRRQFLNHSMVAAGIGAGFAIGGTKSSGRVIGANDTIRIGVAGLNGRGGAHVGEFSKMKGVEITYLIDPDTTTYAKHIKTIAKSGGSTPKTVQDVRQALDDQNLDAISVATPNHWHALMTIWGCQAGKDVYVEKPCSHNVHEGRIAVEAARKYDRIVQHGTQSRSIGVVGPGGRARQVGPVRQAARLARALLQAAQEHRRQAERRGRPRTSTSTSGSARRRSTPFNANYVHYNWHWFWDFGNGDIGNQGVHQMDIARWMIPGATLPKSVVSLGGRFGYKDQGETPNTQIAVYGLRRHAADLRGPRPQDRRLPWARRSATSSTSKRGRSPATSSTPRGRSKARASRCRRSKPSRAGRASGDHFGNFIAAVRSRKTADLNADILEGHYSSALCHLANISYRLGEQVPFNPPDQGLRRQQGRLRDARAHGGAPHQGQRPEARRSRVSPRPQADGGREVGVVRRCPRRQQAPDPPLPQAVRRARVALLSVSVRQVDLRTKHNSPISRSQVEREMGERATGSNYHESAQISACARRDRAGRRHARGSGRREAASALL